MAFSDLSVRLKGDITDFARKMRQAASIANSTSDAINKGLNRSVNESKFEFKDVARIVQGIMISKVFYGSMNAIRNCTDAVMDFSQQLEYAHMAYSNLFGDTALAAEFINVLKDFAATTPFSFSESEAAAKRLLAYGIQYKNVMYVMQGIMAASAAQNNPYIIESMSRAIGQIYTKGRLMNEEMRQLAEAGIPAYDILKEKLGLTQEQLQNLGNEAIPASTAINALIDGMNERFGGVVANSTKTLPGIISNIKDNAVMIVSGIFDPLYQKIKHTAGAFGDFLSKVRNIYELEGLGGIFQRLIPEELQQQIRMLVANLMNLWTVLKLYLANAFEVCKHAAYALLTVFNAFAPIITIVLDVLAQLIHVIVSNATAMKILTGMLAAATAMWVMFKVKAIASIVVATVVKVIAKALMGLYTVLSILVAHPFWALLIAIGGIVVGLSGGFNKLGKAIQNVFSKLTSLNGVNPNKLFMKDNKKRDSDLSKFNERLDNTADAMDNVGDSSEKAGKKAKKAAEDANKAIKGLLSFDEVFTIKKPDEGTDSGISTPDISDIGNIGDIGDLGDIGGIGDLGDSLIPDIPDFADVANDFVNGFIGALKDRFLSAGIGAILGGILGTILGGPLGAKIGAIAGAIAGWFWDDLCKALGLGDVGKVLVPIATVLGAAIGKAFGHPIIGAAIGAMAGSLIDGIANFIETGDPSKIWTSLVGLIGTALGFALGGPIGSFAGGAIGLAIGKFMELFWDEMANDLGITDTGKLAMPIATVLGTALGLIVGGPQGAIIGTAIGSLIGWIIECISKGFETDDWSQVAQRICTPLGAAIGMAVGHPIIGAAIGTLVGFVTGKIIEGFTTGEFDWDAITVTTGGGIGTAIGAAVGHPIIGAAIGSLVGFVVSKIIEGFTTGDFDWIAIATPIGGGIGAAIGAVAGGPIGALIGAAIGALVGWIASKFLEADWSKVTEAFLQPFREFGQMVSAIFDFIWTPIKQAFDNGDWLGLGLNIVLGIVTGILTSVGVITGAIVAVFQAVWDAFCEIFGIHSPAAAMIPIGMNIILGILQGMQDFFGTVLNWIAEAGKIVISSINGWFTSVGTFISSWATNAYSTVSDWATDTASSIGTWATNTASSVGTWATDTANHISSWASKTVSSVSSTISTTSSQIASWVTSNGTKIATFVGDSVQKFTTFASSSSAKFKQFVSDTSSKVSSWASDMRSKASSTMTTFSSSVNSGLGKALSYVNTFVSKAMSAIKSWASNFGKSISNVISGASDSISDFVTSAGSKISDTLGKAKKSSTGHASGGVFNKEHIARFAEGNRAEAIIPLENKPAMQPFVDAVSDGITQTLAPIIASMSTSAGNSNAEALRPLYVGTLIADERSLKELSRKMQLIQVKEDRRRG